MSTNSAPHIPGHQRDLLAEIAQLSSDKTSIDAVRPAIAPHHDAVDRWFITQLGFVPSPEMKRTFKPRVERVVHRTPRDEERDLGELLFRTGYNPDEERIAARRVGVDLTTDSAWQSLNKLVKEARLRDERRKPRVRDPRAVDVAASHRAEKRLKRAAKTAESAGKSHSKMSRAKAPRSDSRDRDVLVEIQGFLAADIPVRLTPKKLELVRPEILSAVTEAPHASSEAVIWLPHWEKASLDLRSMAMGVAAARDGARDFTLHLDDDVIRYAHGDGDMQFARRMRRRIGDQLAKAFRTINKEPPEFAFFVEQGKGQRPHLHGFIFIPDGVKLALVREALRDAGGHGWKPAGKDLTQAEIGSLYEPVGWIGYCTKFARLTKEEIGDNTFAASNSIRRMGREWYEDVRRTRGLLLPRKAAVI